MNIEDQIELIRSSHLADQVFDRLVFAADDTATPMDERLSGLARLWLDKSELPSVEVRPVYASPEDMGKVDEARHQLYGEYPAISESEANIAIKAQPQEEAEVDWFDAFFDEMRSDQAEPEITPRTLQSNLSVRRVGRTEIIEVSYSATNASDAAKAANAFAETYIEDQVQTRKRALEDANSWLSTRIATLRYQLVLAEREAKSFRQKTGLLETMNGRPVDRKLSNLDDQIADAHTDLTKLRARQSKFSDIVEAGDFDVASLETFSHAISSNLRTRYLDASKRNAEMSALLGPLHERSVQLRSDMGHLQWLMFEEVKRAAIVAANEVEIAQNRVHALEAERERVVVHATASQDDEIVLNDLERRVDALRNLHLTYLQHHREALQQQSFPFSDARVVSKAVPPDYPVRPRRYRVIALFIGLGGLVGGGLAAGMELRDQSIRTFSQLNACAGVRCVGILPKIAGSAAASETRFASGPDAKRGLFGQDSRGPIDRAAYGYANTEVVSGFSEGIRALRCSLTSSAKNDTSRILGIISALDGDGKTTVAINLARQLTAEGARVLLVDAHFQRSTLSRVLAQDAQIGLQDILSNSIPWKPLVRQYGETKLFVLPAGAPTRSPFSQPSFTSDGLSKILQDASNEFDFVIVDLPALIPVSHAQSALPHLDTIVLVTAWGQTPCSAVQHALALNPVIGERLHGVVLNRVDVRKARRYDPGFAYVSS
ncbi:MAG: AAA family ATPase [Pseudomonadota bacterium]